MRINRLFLMGMAVLWGVNAYSDSKTVSLSVSSSSVYYTIYSGTPYTSGYDSASLSGDMGLTLFYDPVSPGNCPNVTSASFGTNSVSALDVLIPLNWGGTNGSYQYDVDEVSGRFTGSNLPVSYGAFDTSNASLVVDGGTAVETGTGNVGSNFNRTTSFSSNNKTYSVYSNSSLTVSSDGLGGCNISLQIAGSGNETLWTSPTTMTLGFSWSATYSGNASF